MGRGRRGPGAAGGFAVLITLCVAALVLFTVYVREGEDGPLHTVQLGAAEILRPVQGLFGFVASPFAAAGDRVETALDASGRQELETKALEYEEGAAETARLRQENERLRELLKGQRSSFTYAPLARVVSPVGGQLTERVKIDVGMDDGVGPDMPVVVGDNVLVGRTTERVTPNTAEVLLITDQNFAAGVRILPQQAPDGGAGGESTNGESTSGESTSGESTSRESTTVGSTGEGTTASSGETTSSGGGPVGEGLLRTNWEGYLGVDYVDLRARAEAGDFVVTSGKAGDRDLLFPEGLLIGTIESASAQDIDQYKKIVVTPAARPDDLDEVRVIVDW